MHPIPRPRVLNWFRNATASLMAIASGAALAQGTLTNGGSGTGDISVAGEADNWTFDAAAGAGVMVRAGSSVLTPRLRVFGPDNAPLAESTWVNTGTRDGFAAFQAPSAGTYTVLSSAAYAAQTGAYRLSLAVTPSPITVPPDDQGGDLVNGAAHPGTLQVGDLDVWGFTATGGESLYLRVGSDTATPWLRLYRPDGALVAQSTWVNSGTRDAYIATRLTNAGPYAVVVSAAYSGQAGAYALHGVRAPGTITTSEGDQGGELANGAATPATLPVGDLDAWTFQGTAGETVVLRAGSEVLTPWIRLYGPDGELVGESTWVNSGTRDGLVSVRLGQTGPYTAVVSAVYASQNGDYTMHRASSPGSFVTRDDDEGGSLPNGAFLTGSIPIGDLDLWSFAAKAGDRLHLRMGSTNLTPWVQVFAPDGALAGQSTWVNSGTRDGQINLVATNAGLYTVVASSAYSGQAGTYGLHLAQVPGSFTTSPGDHGGAFPNGVALAGTIALGDLDLWSFEAAAGETVFVRMGAPAFTPWLRAFGPDGLQIDESTWVNSGTRDALVTFRATTSGTHTILAAAVYSGQSGDYTLHRAAIPGSFEVSPEDDGGPLTNGQTYAAGLPLGDLDIWSFVGTPGDSNVFRVTGTNLTPWLTVVAPDGAILRQSIPVNTGTRQATVTLPITNAGLYTVVLTPYYAGQGGTYSFKQSRFPPDLIHPESATLAEGTTFETTLTAQDPDEPDKPLQFNLLSAPPGMTLVLLGATNARVTWATSEALGPSTNLVVATVTDVVAGRPFTRTNAFPVVVEEHNQPPVLQLPADLAVDEGTPVTLDAVATDADLPPNDLAFSLVEAPEGMTLDPTTGAISWTPTEAQGPAVHTVAVAVTDSNPWAVDARHLAVTNTFRITVREINRPPSLALPPATVLDELTPFAGSAVATDADLPANPLTFGLIAAPLGFAIDPVTGVMAWTPAENQGPAEYTLAVVVTDSNPSASNTTRLSTTNTFVVSVREVNSAPRMPVLAESVATEGEPISVDSRATDADLPANGLTYVLTSAPAGASVAADGIVSWTPSESDGGSTQDFVVVARDDGSPALASTNAFRVAVTEVNTAPTLTVPADLTLAEGTALAASAGATDPDQPANPLTFRLAAAPEGLTIDPASGALSWTPTEAQGPSSHLVAVVVTDLNTHAAALREISVTNTFRVTVSEVNDPPSLAPIDDVSVHYGSPVAVAAIGSDPDLPANLLTYSLEVGPAGLSLDARTGALAWNPVSADVGVHPVTVRVTDDGTPSRSATVSFEVTVFGAGARLGILVMPGGLKQITSTGEPGLDYELQASSDLRTWVRLVDFRMTAAPSLYIDPQSTQEAPRFYRLRLLPP